MSLFMILTAPFANLNILSNPAMAQEYNENYSEDKKFSKYPTDEKKYECRTGPFEGFFVSSVEFCKFKFDDRKDHRDNRTGIQGPPGVQGPPGIQGLQGAPGVNGINGVNGVNGTNGFNGTEIDPCVACLLDALVKLDSGAVLVNVTAEIEFSGDRVENITLPLVIDVDVALLLQQQLANATGLDPDATIFEICTAIDEQGLDIQAVIDGLEVTLVPIVEEQISKLVLTIVAAINDLLGTSIVLTPEEVIDAVDIDDIVAQITANVEVSLGILQACLGQVPPPPPPPAVNNVYVTWRDTTPSNTTGNYDTFFAVSNNNGQTFGTPINLSNNTGTSEAQQIATVGNNVYVTWQDNTPGNFDIFFAASTDNGQTFTNPPLNLSSSTGDSLNPQIAAVGNNVYVTWTGEPSGGGNFDIFFAASTDNGQTFTNPPLNLSNNTGVSFESTNRNSWQQCICYMDRWNFWKL